MSCMLCDGACGVVQCHGIVVSQCHVCCVMVYAVSCNVMVTVLCVLCDGVCGVVQCHGHSVVCVV